LAGDCKLAVREPDGLYEAKLDAINPTNVQSLFSAAGTK
jgi:hypothetical protein